MFKYSPINSYALRNLQKNQIYFNNPLNFNDPFDTFHPAKINELSNEKFVEQFCNSSKRNFNKKALLEILNKSISKKISIIFAMNTSITFLTLRVKTQMNFLKTKKIF